MKATIQTSWKNMPDSVVDTQLQSSLCSQLAIPSDSSSTSERMNVDIDIMNPSKANLFILVDGVDGEELALRHDSLSSGIKPIRSSYSPSSSSSALLATLLTGETPKIHGIVADKWEYLGETEYAYVHVFPGSAQVPDILAQSSNGQARIVSASASPIFARALNVRPRLMQYAQQSTALHFNTKSKLSQLVEGFEHRNHHENTQMTQDELISLLQSHFRDLVLIDTPEHKTLYAELALILKSVSNLHTFSKQQLGSGIHSVDMFNFAISALNPIRALHAADSNEFVSALTLVRQVISRSIEKIQNAYGVSTTSIQVVCTKSTKREAQNAQLIADVAQILPQVQRAIDFFPNIYTSDDNMCAIFRERGIEAYCPNTYGDRRSIQQDWLSVYSTISADERTIIIGDDADQTVASWHMFMFTWLLFILVTYFIWYYFYSMDIGEDSLLYRITSIPNPDGPHNHHFKDQ